MRIKGYVDSITSEGIVGWAVDADNPEASVEVVVQVNGAERGRCVADIDRPSLAKSLGSPFTGRHEFRYSFVPPLNVRVDTPIVVRTAETKVPLEHGVSVLRGLPVSRAPLMPILLGSRGRSGTTLLMSEFARHPDIVVGDAYPYEVKYAAYYAASLPILTLAPPEDDPDFAENADKYWTIHGNPANRQDVLEAVGGPSLVRFMEEAVPRRLSETFRQFVLEAYSIIANEHGKTGARFFAEKSSLGQNVRYGIRSLFGEVREIILVRDPRDYMCSAKAFWQQSMQKTLGLLEATIPEFERIHAQAGSDVMFVRYEDLILDPLATRERIYRFIGIANAPLQVAACDIPSAHMTSANPAASIGRWQHDLTPDEVSACTRLCGSYMERFGYS